MHALIFPGLATIQDWISKHGLEADSNDSNKAQCDLSKDHMGVSCVLKNTQLYNFKLVSKNFCVRHDLRSL